MKKVATDYKGKYFDICDEDRVYDDDIILNYIDIDKIISNDKELRQHVWQCRYYGIPPYIGNDDELNKRIDRLQEEYDKTKQIKTN